MSVMLLLLKSMDSTMGTSIKLIVSLRSRLLQSNILPVALKVHPISKKSNGLFPMLKFPMNLEYRNVFRSGNLAMELCCKCNRFNSLNWLNTEVTFVMLLLFN